MRTALHAVAYVEAQGCAYVYVGVAVKPHTRLCTSRGTRAASRPHVCGMHGVAQRAAQLYDGFAARQGAHL